MTQSDDLEARRIELDRNLWTDLQARRIEWDGNLGTDLQPRRLELDQNIGTDPVFEGGILGDDYQNPITEDTEVSGKVGVDMPHVHSWIHSNCTESETVSLDVGSRLDGLLALDL